MSKRNTGKLNTTKIAIFGWTVFGGAIGAVLGVIAYTNNWLG